jgi:hypothetical protein
VTKTERLRMEMLVCTVCFGVASLLADGAAAIVACVISVSCVIAAVVISVRKAGA